MKCTHLSTPKRTHNIGNFRMYSMSMAGSLKEATRHHMGYPQEVVTIPSKTNKGGEGANMEIWQGQYWEAVANTSPINQLHIGQGFKQRLAMYTEEEMTGEAVTLMDTGQPLCMSYHLKCVCNSNCGRFHVHQRLVVIENIPLVEWKPQFYSSMPPPVM